MEIVSQIVNRCIRKKTRERTRTMNLRMNLTTQHFLAGVWSHAFFYLHMYMMDDPHCVTLAVAVTSAMSCSRYLTILPEHVRWQMSAYTNWNLSMLLTRYLLNVGAWDPFLCVNSVGIWLGFRTAFSQGLDENIRLKLYSMGMKMSRRQFVLADHCVHTLPAIGMVAHMVRKGKRIPSVAVTYAIVLLSWFVLREVGNLDGSKKYVPHPWKRGWLAFLVGTLSASSLVNAANARNYRRFVAHALVLLLPYLSTRLDPTVKDQYNLLFRVLRAHPLYRRIPTSTSFSSIETLE